MTVSLSISLVATSCLAGVLLLSGCGDHPDTSVQPTCATTTEGIQETILVPTCGASGCHGAAGPALGLDLVSPGLAQRIANAASNGCGDKTIVVPGDPSHSYLFDKLTQVSPSCGERMPFGGTPLGDAQLTCLRNWVSQMVALPDAGSDAAGITTGDAGDASGATDTGLSCPTAQVACNGKCTDVATDNANCGSCGKACAAGTSCTQGQCRCATGLSLCGGACFDTATNTVNCGSCGNACATGQTCSAGQCTCQSGLTLCSGACVDLSSSNGNCGTCGHACGGGVCSAGKCLSSCPAGSTNCSGSCVSLLTSSMNCGTCGHVCGSGLSCVSGACACPTGTTLCGSTCVDVKTDSSNCGTCGLLCASGTSCSLGTCICPSGQMLCGSTCVNTGSDSSNCGTCGHVCPSGSSCSSGACVCPSGQTLCGSSCVNTASDPSNCGVCGRACPSGQLCTAGVCGCGATVSFANQVQPIFTNNCTSGGCHAGMKPAASMSLLSGSSYGAIVNVASSSCTGRLRVAPGSAPNSYLMNKLTGFDMCSGTAMPKTGSSLSAAELNTISAWICVGAPKN